MNHDMLFDEARERRRAHLLEMARGFNKLLTPCFNFGLVKKEESPKEYFVVAVLNKLFSLNISLENIIFTNDVFLLNYLYRYVYELYVKVFYIFSGSDDAEINEKIKKFFDNKRMEIKDYLENINESSIPPKLKEEHKEKYLLMNRMAHPNINSLNMHLNKTKEQQFDFLVPTVNLIFWHNAEIMRVFSYLKILGVDKSLDLDKLYSLQTQ